VAARGPRDRGAVTVAAMGGARPRVAPVRGTTGGVALLRGRVLSVVTTARVGDLVTADVRRSAESVACGLSLVVSAEHPARGSGARGLSVARARPALAAASPRAATASGAATRAVVTAQVPRVEGRPPREGRTTDVTVVTAVPGRLRAAGTTPGRAVPAEDPARAMVPVDAELPVSAEASVAVGARVSAAVSAAVGARATAAPPVSVASADVTRAPKDGRPASGTRRPAIVTAGIAARTAGRAVPRSVADRPAARGRVAASRRTARGQRPPVGARTPTDGRRGTTAARAVPQRTANARGATSRARRPAERVLGRATSEPGTRAGRIGVTVGRTGALHRRASDARPPAGATTDVPASATGARTTAGRRTARGTDARTAAAARVRSSDRGARTGGPATAADARPNVTTVVATAAGGAALARATPGPERVRGRRTSDVRRDRRRTSASSGRRSRTRCPSATWTAPRADRCARCRRTTRGRSAVTW